MATYSGGMRRRLDIAMSLVGISPVIFLDEPITGLDPQARIEVWHSVQELAGQGTTVLLTTQYLDEAEQLAERFQSLPIARSSVLTSLVASVISVVVVLLVALLVGFRSPAGVPAWLAVAGILILFTVALTWLAVIAGPSAKTVDGAGAFSYPLIFLPFISSAFVLTQTMPGPGARLHRKRAGDIHRRRDPRPVHTAASQHRHRIVLGWCLGILTIAYTLAIATYHRKISRRWVSFGQAEAMLTIGRLASYAGVTIRAVRHYHEIGLLLEPERDARLPHTRRRRGRGTHPDPHPGRGRRPAGPGPRATRR